MLVIDTVFSNTEFLFTKVHIKLEKIYDYLI